MSLAGFNAQWHPTTKQSKSKVVCNFALIVISFFARALVEASEQFISKDTN